MSKDMLSFNTALFKPTHKSYYIDIEIDKPFLQLQMFSKKCFNSEEASFVWLLDLRMGIRTGKVSLKLSNRALTCSCRPRLRPWSGVAALSHATFGISVPWFNLTLKFSSCRLTVVLVALII